MFVWFWGLREKVRLAPSSRHSSHKQNSKGMKNTFRCCSAYDSRVYQDDSAFEHFPWGGR
ncbi:hypothetical protein [Halobacillus faecis]